MTASVPIVFQVIFIFGSATLLIRFAASSPVYPNVLETTIITERDETIKFRWVEVESFLVNGNLPIWTTMDNNVVEDMEVMNRIGQLRMYHDIEKSSAVVLVENWNCIFGIVDVRYTIACIPLDELSGHQHIVGESPNIMTLPQDRIGNHENPQNFWRPFAMDEDKSDSEDNQNDYKMLVKTWMKPEPNLSCHRKRQRVQVDVNTASTFHEVAPSSIDSRSYEDYEDLSIVTYPEILILVPHDVASFTHHIDTLVLQYIVQFNAVAMLYAKLATHNIKIHINMAGMIIDRGYLFFPPGKLLMNASPGGELVLRAITKYLKELRDPYDSRRQLFYDDSFDMFIFSTTKDWREKDFDPSGFPTRVLDLMSIRNVQTHSRDKEFLGALVNYPDIIRQYVNIAREIAHLMTVRDDPTGVNICRNGDQCYGIMQQGQYNCPNCLIWSQRSVQDFKKFLSVNTNRCFLRNLPRSLQPAHVPVKTFTPADQCLCYGYTPVSGTHLTGRPSRVCSKGLQCRAGSQKIKAADTVLPIDGTPCDTKDDTKVCWRHYCVPMRKSHRNL